MADAKDMKPANSLLFPRVIDGKIYLVPIDACETSSNLAFREALLSVDTVIRIILGLRNNKKVPIIVILDCCRLKSNDDGNSFKGSVDLGQETNIAILYSTAEGHVAVDGSNNSNSPYTKLLLENLVKGWTISEINSAIVKGFENSGRKQVSICGFLSFRWV